MMTRVFLLLCWFQLAHGWGGMSRRSLLQHAAAAAFIAPASSAAAAETIGKNEDCNDRTCLGVWDGLLADCPHTSVMMGGGPGCTSSQDDTPGIFAEPWDYSEMNSLDWKVQQDQLFTALQRVCAKRGGDETVRLVLQQGRYTRVMFTNGKTAQQSIGEFYFTPDDTTVQFRIAAAASGLASSSSLFSYNNLDRSEAIRKELGYLKLPVLRNRKRALLFVESRFDSFGPSGAAIGPPAEMKTGELEGIGRDVDPTLKIDLLQQFPRTFP